MVLPELLRGILPSDPLNDLLASGVLLLERGHVVNILVNDDEKIIGLAVGGHFLLRVNFGHV